jgi:hypothetical protein
MAPNDSSAAICSGCGSALFETNMLVPGQAMYADGVAVSNAVYRPTRPVVVIVIWMLFLPGLIVSPFGMLAGIGMPGAAGFVIFWMSAGLAVISATALFRVTKGYFTKPR